jgi:putative membrane protein
MGWGMMGYDGQWYGHPWAWFGHGLWFLLFVGLAIALVVVLARYLGRAEGGGKNALGILEERYARGEIDREEFMQRKRDLS